MYKAYKKQVTKYFKWGDPNVTIVGSPTVSNGVVSGFSASKYITTPYLFVPSTNTWEIVVKVKTGALTAVNNILGAQTAFKTGMALYINTDLDNKLGLALSSNGTSYNIVAVNKALGSKLYSANTVYYFKVEFTGSEYNAYYSLDGKQWTLDITVTSSANIIQSQPWTLGGGVIGGSASYYNTASVDLNGCHINLNGKRWWNGLKQVAGTSSDHDFTKLQDIYYAMKQNDKYYTYKGV